LAFLERNLRMLAKRAMVLVAGLADAGDARTVKVR
jgi:hypothetical protein